MARGRKPKPTALKKLAGNPGKRALSKKEPKPRAASRVPTAPAYLSTIAKQCWKYYAKELYQLGLLSKVDRFAFEGFCQNYGLYVEAEKVLETEDKVVMTFNTLKKNPWLEISRNARLDALKFAVEFGLTPSARTRVDVDPNEVAKAGASDSEFEKFKKKKGLAMGIG